MTVGVVGDVSYAVAEGFPEQGGGKYDLDELSLLVKSEVHAKAVLSYEQYEQPQSVA